MSEWTTTTLRSLWRDAGGNFHGPRVETGTMPEAKLLPFLQSILDRIDQLQTENDELKAAQQWITFDAEDESTWPVESGAYIIFTHNGVEVVWLWAHRVDWESVKAYLPTPIKEYKE